MTRNNSSLSNKGCACSLQVFATAGSQQPGDMRHEPYLVIEAGSRGEEGGGGKGRRILPEIGIFLFFVNFVTATFTVLDHFRVLLFVLITFWPFWVNSVKSRGSPETQDGRRLEIIP